MGARYELENKTSNKFWEIDLAGKVVTTTYGRIGSKGQKTIKRLATPAAARAFHDKLVSEKTRKGYKRAGQEEAPPPSPLPKPGEPSWDLAAAFVPRARMKEDERVYVVELVEPSPLVLPTGKIIACDAYTLFGAAPFERTVKKGTYPVTLSIAKMTGRYKDRRVGCAMVRFAKGKVAKWVNATKKGQKIAKLEPGYHYGYGVDAGVGCFADASVLPNLEIVDDIVRENGGAEGFLYAQTAHDVSEKKWGSAILDSKTKANLLVFHSGWGDGVYPSYWGLSKSGQALCLVTDFGVYPRPEIPD